MVSASQARRHRNHCANRAYQTIETIALATPLSAGSGEVFRIWPHSLNHEPLRPLLLGAELSGISGETQAAARRLCSQPHMVLQLFVSRAGLDAHETPPSQALLNRQRLTDPRMMLVDMAHNKLRDPFDRAPHEAVLPTRLGERDEVELSVG